MSEQDRGVYRLAGDPGPHTAIVIHQDATGWWYHFHQAACNLETTPIGPYGSLEQAAENAVKLLNIVGRLDMSIALLEATSRC